MGKIDTSGWKEFHMVDIGFKVYHGSRITKAERVEGDTVFLTAGFENCGVVGTIGNENIDVWEKPITVDMFGNVFYHDETCAGDDNIYAFLNSKLSRTAKLFVASSIASVTQSKYSYQQQFRQGDANELSVYLPTTPNGAPDWVYMESYLANIETRVADSLTMLQAAKDAEKKKVDTREWKEFRIGDYFKVEYGRFHAKDELGAGTVNYITTSGFNNGITNTCEEATHQGNCITVASDGAMGASFYQEEAFTTSNIVSTLTPLPHTPLNKYNAFFLCAIIFGKRAEFGWLGFKMSVDRVRNLRVKLPSTPDGQPDWVYMEEYMRKVEEKAENVLNHFEKDRNGV